MRSRRSIAALLTVTAIMLMGILVTACGSSTKTYLDTTYKYSVSYPVGWKVQAGGTSEATAGSAAAGTVGIFNPHGTVVDAQYVDVAMIMVYKLNVAVDDPWSETWRTKMDELLTELEGQATDMKVDEALQQTTLAGLKGYYTSYTFSKSDTPVRSALYFLFDGDVEYELTMQAATAVWDDAKPSFDVMLKSFRP
jgi:hypothetical protein